MTVAEMIRAARSEVEDRKPSPAGATADDAIALLREKRSPAVLCNPAFEEYLRGL